MKKTILSVLFAGATLVAVPAFAAECNLGGNGKTVTTTEAFKATGPMTAANIVALIYDYPGYADVKAVCAQDKVVAEFIRLNGNDAIAPDKPFKVPVLVAAPAAQPSVAASPAPTPAMESKPVVQPLPAPKPAASASALVPSPKLAAVRTQRVAAEKELQVVRASNDALPASLQGLAVARITALEQKVAGLKALDDRLTAVEASLKLKADTTYVDTQDNALRVSIGTAQTTADDAKALAAAAQKTADAAGGVSSWLWWLAVLGIPAALLMGLYSLVFKASNRRVKKVETDVKTIDTTLVDMRDALPADIRLDMYWYEAIVALQVGKQLVLPVCVADGEGYYPKFNIRIEKASGNTVGILSGIQGHPAEADIKIGNLQRVVRKAGYDNRLTDRIQLAAVA